MSKKKNKRRQTGGTTPNNTDPGYAIFRALIRIINESPRPSPMWLENDSHEERRRGAMPAMAWGWLQRTMRSGEAAIKLEKSGYGVEAAPLLRSSLEHAIRLLWAESIGDRFVDVAIMAKQSTGSRLIEAQKHGWKFDPEVAVKLERYAEDLGGESKTLGHLAHLKAAVHSTPATLEETGSLYMAWLHYTLESHPSIDTAEPYIAPAADGHYIGLLTTARPREARDCAMLAIFAAIGAAHGYSRLARLEEYFEPRLQEVLKRHDSYFQDMPKPEMS